MTPGSRADSLSLAVSVEEEICPRLRAQVEVEVVAFWPARNLDDDAILQRPICPVSIFSMILGPAGAGSLTGAALTLVTFAT